MLVYDVGAMFILYIENLHGFLKYLCLNNQNKSDVSVKILDKIT